MKKKLTMIVMATVITMSSAISSQACGCDCGCPVCDGYSISYSGDWYYISSQYAPGIAIRQLAADDSVLLTRIPYGTEFCVQYYDGDWGYTSVWGYSGWINLNYAEYIDTCGTNIYDCTYYGQETYGLYRDGHVLYDYEYVVSDSNSRYLSQSDIQNLTLKGLCYARNEIYARHGRKFLASELQSFFNGQTWYYGYLNATTSNDQMIVSSMNAYEKYNIDLLQAAEKKLGTYSVK